VTEDQVTNPDPAQGESQGSLDAVKGLCDGIIRHLAFDLKAEMHGEEDVVCVNLTGPDRPLLLSNAASVLNSLEYLLNKVFRTGKGEKIQSITLDCDKYRQHREAELVLLAKMASEKVIAQGRPLNLQPMIPRERRIVHLALAEIEGVRSESGGEGDNRSITIYPTEVPSRRS
jgi:spoIIIJ-associated protein